MSPSGNAWWAGNQDWQQNQSGAAPTPQPASQVAPAAPVQSAPPPSPAPSQQQSWMQGKRAPQPRNYYGQQQHQSHAPQSSQAAPAPSYPAASGGQTNDPTQALGYQTRGGAPPVPQAAPQEPQPWSGAGVGVGNQLMGGESAGGSSFGGDAGMQSPADTQTPQFGQPQSQRRPAQMPTMTQQPQKQRNYYGA